MTELRYTEEGNIRVIRGSIVIVEGFKNCLSGQVVKFGYGTRGIIIGFDEHEAQVLLIRQQEKLKTVDKVVATLEAFETIVGDKFIGRILNPLGEALDGLGPLEYDTKRPIFIDAPSILKRKVLNKTLETGVKVIDTMIPVGFGQRELILGDKMTGKTTICTDTIINQKHTGVICIYCCIGKSQSSLGKVVQLLIDHDCFKYTVIVAATAAAPSGQLYLSPYVACAIGEHYMYQGKNVFVAFDDLTKHAWAYREISLLLGRAPGRDSYPGDIFYLHSKMVERAAYLSDDLGGGSMTHFPIVETLEGDLTGYVQSNLVSMTDGQLYFSTPLFAEGQRPAIDLGLSVSRVGSKVQWSAVKKLSGALRLEYLQYREVLRVSKLKTSGQSEEAEEQMKKVIEHFQTELSSMRTGRAHVSLVDGIKAEYYGSWTPLAQVANIGVVDARTLEIKPWDKEALKAVEQAILKSELGVTPINDGKVIRLTMPTPNTERRKELVRTIKKQSEDFKVAIRNVRRDTIETLKKQEKEKLLTQDDLRRHEQEIQKLTDLQIKKIDEILAVKEKEILEV